MKEIGNTVLSEHCEGDNPKADKLCPVPLKEQEILDTKESQKVTIRRARQIHANGDYVTKTPKMFATHFNYIMDEVQKINLSPCLLEKYFTHEIGGKPKSIRYNNIRYKSYGHQQYNKHSSGV